MLLNKENKLTVAVQCCLLQVTRSRIYYKANGEHDAPLANAIADCYRQYPIYGYRRSTACLKREDYIVNQKCIFRVKGHISTPEDNNKECGAYQIYLCSAGHGGGFDASGLADRYYLFAHGAWLYLPQCIN